MATKIPYADETVNGPVDCRHSGMRTNNPNWRGGKHVSSHGYIKILVGVNHHLADPKGYAYEHRLIAEKILGRRLKLEEKVHHIDGNKTNNRPENIKVVIGNAGHYLEHRKPHSHLRKPYEPNPLVFCDCGCGRTFWRFDSQGRPRNFISGHNTRTKNGQYTNSVL